jgi:hypothetical protein
LIVVVELESEEAVADVGEAVPAGDGDMAHGHAAHAGRKVEEAGLVAPAGLPVYSEGARA